MNTQKPYFLSFKDQIVDAVINHSQKLFKPFLGVYLIYSVIAVIILLPIVLFMMPDEFIQMLQDIVVNGNQPDPSMFEDMDESIFLERLPQLIGGGSLLFVLAMILTSWQYNWALKMSRSVIEEGNPNFQSTLSASFDSGIWRLLGLSLITVLIYIGLVLVLALLAAALKVLVILFVIPVVLLLLRLTISFPAAITGEMSVMESLRFSWSHIGWGRAGKLFLAGIVFIVVLILLSLLSNLITALAGTGALSIALNLIIQIITGTLVLAFTIAGLNGLFYRYGEFELASADTEDEHLID